MDFKQWSTSDYAKADQEELEQRKSDIIELLKDEKATVASEVLVREKDMLLSEFEKRNTEVQLRNARLEKVLAGAGRVIDSSEVVAPKKEKEAHMDMDMYATDEYLRAFYNYVVRGTHIPDTFKRDSALTKTSDTAAVIPTTLMNTIIEKMESYGEIFAAVTKLNIQGGIEYPILDLKPTAKWVAEDKTSDKQKLSSTQTVSFKYHELECVLSQSRLASFVTLAEFQAKFPQMAAAAMTKAIETAIIKGTGTGQPQGITTDSRVKTVAELTAAKIKDWQAWHTDVKAKMAKSYRDGVFIMSQATFDGYIDGMVDKSGQPVGRVTYGIDGEETYRFMGKRVVTVEPELLPDFDTASSGEVFAIFVKLDNYAINSNKQLEMNKWTDYDARTENTGAYMVLDGKLIDPNGVILIKKK